MNQIAVLDGKTNKIEFAPDLPVPLSTKNGFEIWRVDSIVPSEEEYARTRTTAFVESDSGIYVLVRKEGRGKMGFCHRGSFQHGLKHAISSWELMFENEDGSYELLLK